MNEFRVPTVAVAVELIHADGRVEKGRVFVPPVAEHHSGAMRPDEWINAHEPFFPFLPDGAQRAWLVNKGQVVCVSVAVDPSQTCEGDPRKVEVCCGERSWQGEVWIAEEVGHRRVQDHLNRPDAFLSLRDVDRSHLIQKSHVTRVTELEEPGVPGKDSASSA